MSPSYPSVLLCHLYLRFPYLLDLARPEVPVAQEVQEVPQAPHQCFPEYRGFQGCPVAPVGPGDRGDQGGPAQTFSFL